MDFSVEQSIFNLLKTEMESSQHSIVVHGVVVNVDNVGVIIIGESSVGKSECALELISCGHSLIADDVIELENVDGRLFGKAPKRFAGLIEIRGLGIFDVKSIFTENAYLSVKQIELCIEFHGRNTKFQFDRLGQSAGETSFAGVTLPKFDISVGRGRNPAMLVETAVKLNKLKDSGVYLDLIKSHDELVSSSSSLD